MEEMIDLQGDNVSEFNGDDEDGKAPSSSRSKSRMSALKANVMKKAGHTVTAASSKVGKIAHTATGKVQVAISSVRSTPTKKSIDKVEGASGENKEVYLDFNATTPILKEVANAMLPFLERVSRRG